MSHAKTVNHPVRIIVSDYIATFDDFEIEINAGANPVALTLPDPSTATEGFKDRYFVVVVKNKTFEPSLVSPALINDSAAAVILSQIDSRYIVRISGTEWSMSRSSTPDGGSPLLHTVGESVYPDDQRRVGDNTYHLKASTPTPHVCAAFTGAEVSLWSVIDTVLIGSNVTGLISHSYVHSETATSVTLTGEGVFFYKDINDTRSHIDPTFDVTNLTTTELNSTGTIRFMAIDEAGVITPFIDPPTSPSQSLLWAWRFTTDGAGVGVAILNTTFDRGGSDMDIASTTLRDRKNEPFSVSQVLTLDSLSMSFSIDSGSIIHNSINAINDMTDPSNKALVPQDFLIPLGTDSFITAYPGGTFEGDRVLRKDTYYDGANPVDTIPPGFTIQRLYTARDETVIAQLGEEIFTSMDDATLALGTELHTPLALTRQSNLTAYMIIKSNGTGTAIATDFKYVPAAAHVVSQVQQTLTSEFSDAVHAVYNSVDNSKRLEQDVSEIDTLTTRTNTQPNENVRYIDESRAVVRTHSALIAYPVIGQQVDFEGDVYYSTVAIAAPEVFDFAKWDREPNVSMWKALHHYEANEVVVVNGQMMWRKNTGTSGAVLDATELAAFYLIDQRITKTATLDGTAIDLDASVYNVMTASGSVATAINSPTNEIFNGTLDIILKATADVTVTFGTWFVDSDGVALGAVDLLSGKTYIFKFTEYGGFYYQTNSAIAAATEIEAVLQRATQAGHGYTVLDPVRKVSGAWVPAQADADDTAAQGIVVEIVDVDNFIVNTHGAYTVPAHGLTENNYYWLDSVVSGLILDQPTIGAAFAQVLVFASDANTILVNVAQPTAILDVDTSVTLHRASWHVNQSAPITLVAWTAIDLGNATILYKYNPNGLADVANDQFVIVNDGDYKLHVHYESESTNPFCNTLVNGVQVARARQITGGTSIDSAVIVPLVAGDIVTFVPLGNWLVYSLEMSVEQLMLKSIPALVAETTTEYDDIEKATGRTVTIHGVKKPTYERSFFGENMALNIWHTLGTIANRDVIIKTHFLPMTTLTSAASVYPMAMTTTPGLPENAVYYIEGTTGRVLVKSSSTSYDSFIIHVEYTKV